MNYECINIHNTAKCWIINIVGSLVSVHVLLRSFVTFIKTQPLNMFTSILEATCLKLKLRVLSTTQTVIEARLTHKCKEMVYSENSRWSQLPPHARSLPTQHPEVAIPGTWLKVVLHLEGLAALCTIPMNSICQSNYSTAKNSAENWLQDYYSLSSFILVTANSLALLTKHGVS